MESPIKIKVRKRRRRRKSMTLVDFLLIVNFSFKHIVGESALSDLKLTLKGAQNG